jgi:hypothetical protein
MELEKINTIIATLALGVGLAPLVKDFLTKSKIKGKIISIYTNQGTFNSKPAALYVFKLSVISLDSDFNLKDIDINFHYKNLGWKNVTSTNQRSTTFTLDGIFKKLTVGSDNYLNNLTILPKNEAISGYLLTFVSDIDVNEEILEYQFLFKDFNNTVKTLKFKKKDISDKKLFHDDSIWTFKL